jgi:hypothetical protein
VFIGEVSPPGVAEQVVPQMAAEEQASFQVAEEEFPQGVVEREVAPRVAEEGFPRWDAE